MITQDIEKESMESAQLAANMRKALNRRMCHAMIAMKNEGIVRFDLAWERRAWIGRN